MTRTRTIRTLKRSIGNLTVRSIPRCYRLSFFDLQVSSSLFELMSPLFHVQGSGSASGSEEGSEADVSEKDDESEADEDEVEAPKKGSLTGKRAAPPPKAKAPPSKAPPVLASACRLRSDSRRGLSCVLLAGGRCYVGRGLGGGLHAGVGKAKQRPG